MFFNIKQERHVHINISAVNSECCKCRCEHIAKQLILPGTAAVPDTHKQEKASWDVECPLPSSLDKTHKCSEYFRK